MDKQSPLVSILIPAYNVATYLPKCLDSVAQQTYTNLQVVIVDDGSTDTTLEIANDYARKYPFFEVLHQENSGVATARNTLITIAKGDYILFVDSDDWIELDMIEQMLKSIEISQADIVVCGNIKEQNNISERCPVVQQDFDIEGEENIIRTFLFHRELNGSLWNKIVPRKYYESLSFRKDIWYGEDCLFFWQTLNKGVKKIHFTNDCFYHYRMNDASISHEKFNYKKMTGHEVWKQINEDVANRYPKLKDIAQAAYAVSDMWLLFYAAQSKQSFDNNLKIFQKNVRHNLFLINRENMINSKKIIFAILIAYNYSLCAYVLRKIMK